MVEFIALIAAVVALGFFAVTVPCYLYKHGQTSKPVRAHSRLLPGSSTVRQADRIRSAYAEMVELFPEEVVDIDELDPWLWG
jgi:hypothetical protein